MNESRLINSSIPISPVEMGSTSHKGWRPHGVACVMLLCWFGLAIHTCQSMSVTFDEIWHLPVGVRNLRDGDFAEDRLNPPLSRMWAAIPLLLAGVSVSPSTESIQIGERFVAEHADYQKWYEAGRCFHLLWPLLTAVLLYGVVWHAWGPPAARLSLLTLLCCPDFIAHGSIVTPDAAAMFFFLLSSAVLSWWSIHPQWKNSIVLGLVIGALQGVKYTGVVFIPTVLIVALGVWWRERHCRTPRFSGGRLVVLLLALMGASLVTLAACYRFQGLFERWDSLAFQSVDLRTIHELTVACGPIPVPIPRDFLLGLDAQRAIMESAHPTFLNGEWSLTGFRSYFLLAIAYKLPLAMWGMALGGFVWIARQFHRIQALHSISYLAPVGILLLIASFSSMQLGVRYVMPVIPLLAMAAGVSSHWFSNGGHIRRFAFWVIALAGLLSVWRYHPHHLSYFNEYAGGPIRGREHLVDSNIDWGQDLLRAKQVYDSLAQESPHFAYFGTVDPHQLGMQCIAPSSRHPEPGVYLVSVNFVMGRPGSMREGAGPPRSVDLDEFGYFRWLKPSRHIGYSIDLYRISREDCEFIESQMRASPYSESVAPR